MEIDLLRDVPAEPPSIAEWEELLVRLDIAPRAVRVAVDDLPRVGDEVLRVLQLAVARETWFAGVIEHLRLGAAFSLRVGFAPVAPGAAYTAADATELCRDFELQRTRNFAQVQRRGLEVWKWASPVDDGGTLTVYQALTLLARADGETLAMLRAAGRGERTA